MRAMTKPQRLAVERLLTKGWIEPLRYRSSVYLFLPHVEAGRKRRISRDWRRKPIVVTPAGDIVSVQVWTPEQEEIQLKL